MSDMIILGAYLRGSDPLLDEAIKHYPEIENFLAQEKNERVNIEEGYANISSILDFNNPQIETDDSRINLDIKSKIASPLPMIVSTALSLTAGLESFIK